MDDLIDRQTAIDAIKEDKIDLTNPNVVAVFKATGNFEKAETQVMTCDRHIKILKELPPAQPEIIRCKDCNHFYKDNLNQWCFLGKYGVKEDDFCSRAERKTNE